MQERERRELRMLFSFFGSLGAELFPAVFAGLGAFAFMAARRP